MATVKKKAVTKKAVKKKVVVSKNLTALQIGTDLVQKAFKTKKLDDPFVAINEDSFKKSLPHLPTGSTMVDYLIGGKLNRYGVPPCPGIPKGKVINLYGRESAGKTTMALTIAAKTIANGGTVAYIDWENAIVNDYAKALGVPVDDEAHFKLVQPNTLEEGLMVIWAFAKAGVDLIVIDSVGAGVPKAVMEQSLDEKGSSGRIGAVAAMWSNFLPQLRGVIKEGITVKDKKKVIKKATAIIGISQLRSAINTSGYGAAAGDGGSTQGGNAWKFYSDVRIGMTRLASEKTEGYDTMKHKKEKLSSGAKIRVRADKCKVSASQGRDVEIYIKYGYGIDDLRSLILYGSTHKILKKEGGGWFTWERGNGEILRVQGMEKFKDLIYESAGAIDELYAQATAAIYSSDDVLVDPDADTAEDMSMMEINNILEGKNADGSGMEVSDDSEVAKVQGALVDEENSDG